MLRAACLIVLAAGCPAQVLQVWSIAGMSTSQGFQALAAFTNTTSVPLSLSGNCPLAILTPEGDPTKWPCVQVPIYPALTTVAPGASVTITFNLPARPPGRWLLVLSARDALYQQHRAVASAEVVPSSVPAPALAFWPGALAPVTPLQAVSFADPSTTPWVISNTGPVAHAFGPGDAIEVLAPGGSTPLASLSLAGVSVSAGGAVEVLLPVAGLAAGPYTLRATWFDPALGAQASPTHGIRSQLAGAEVRAIEGREVPLSGTLRVDARVDTFFFFGPYDFLFVVSNTPGSMVLPGGSILPVAPDWLFNLALSGGLGAFFSPLSGTVAPGPNQIPEIVFTHPGPALSGLGFRVAALVLDQSTGQLRTSQSEDLILR